MSGSNNDHVVVLVDEEYGFKHHIWHTDMAIMELEKFWASVVSFHKHYLNPSASMPGRWQEVKSEQGLKDFFDAWDAKNHYVAHIHWDDDSYLRAPDGRKILHAGYIKG